MANGLVVSAQPAGEVDDPVLDALSDAAETDAELFRPMGEAEPQQPEQGLDRPVDLRFSWTAVSLRSPRPGRERSAGAAELIPVLIVSTVTPFAQEGRRPPPVWGLGYEAQLAGAGQAQTISIFPDSETVTKASMGPLRVGLGASGKISFPCALRLAPSVVISAFALDTAIRSPTAEGAKPPNTTLCGAPIRAQASMATTTSGIIGR